MGGYAIGMGHFGFIGDVHILALCTVSTSLEQVFAVHA